MEHFKNTLTLIQNLDNIQYPYCTINILPTKFHPLNFGIDTNSQSQTLCELHLLLTNKLIQFA